FDIALPGFIVSDAPLGLLPRQSQSSGDIADAFRAIVFLVVRITIGLHVKAVSAFPFLFDFFGCLNSPQFWHFPTSLLRMSPRALQAACCHERGLRPHSHNVLRRQIYTRKMGASIQDICQEIVSLCAFRSYNERGAQGQILGDSSYQQCAGTLTSSSALP